MQHKVSVLPFGVIKSVKMHRGQIQKSRMNIQSSIRRTFQNLKTFAGQRENRLMLICFLFPFMTSNWNIKPCTSPLSQNLCSSCDFGFIFNHLHISFTSKQNVSKDRFICLSRYPVDCIKWFPILVRNDIQEKMKLGTIILRKARKA